MQRKLYSACMNLANIVPAIKILTNGATSSGFGKVAQFESRFGEGERETVRGLRSLLDPEGDRTITLDLDDCFLYPWQIYQLTEIYKRLPGGTGVTLPSFGRPEYSIFSPSDKIGIHADVTFRPYRLMSKGFPMVSLQAPNSFTSVKEAIAQHLYT